MRLGEGGSPTEDSEHGGLIVLRKWVKDLAEECEDMDLLDLVGKLLANG